VNQIAGNNHWMTDLKSVMWFWCWSDFQHGHHQGSYFGMGPYEKNNSIIWKWFNRI